MDQKVADLFDDAIIKARVHKVWEEVFNASSIIVRHAKEYGFLGMTIIPDPNIHQMLVTISLLDAHIDTFLREAFDYDEKRLLLNAKKQLTQMEVVAAALSENNRSDFDVAMKGLEGQAAF